MELQFTFLAGLCVFATISIASVNSQTCSTGMACLEIQSCRVPSGMIFCCPTGGQLTINATTLQCNCSTMNFNHNCYGQGGLEWKRGSDLLQLTTARTTTRYTMPSMTTTCKTDLECYSTSYCTLDNRKYCCPGGYVTASRSEMTTSCVCEYNKGTGSSCTSGSSPLATSASAAIGALLLVFNAATRL